MKGAKKVLLPVLTILYILSSTLSVFADGETLKLTVEEAVLVGLENSIQLKQVQTQIDLSKVGKERAREINRDLEDGQREVWDGRTSLYNSEDQIRQLESLTPEQLAALGLTPEDVQQMRDALEEGELTLSMGENEFDSALQKVADKIGEKIGMESSYEIGTYNTRKMLEKMSEISYEVTQASYDIYKNQIALLIQKSYYDVLKAQKMLQVKEKAMERAKKQYEFAKASYEEGMKAKDDVLMANIYYKGTLLEQVKAKGELNNAMIALKKNLNIGFDTEIELTDVLAEKAEQHNLQSDIENGLRNRLEIKKANGEKSINILNFKYIEDSYKKNDYQYKEAQLLKEKSIMNLEQIQLEVENTIRQSYETLMSLGEMMKTSAEMVEQAKENLEIAEYKYQEGFGVDTSFLKKLDLESTAGTMVEVLAAEENLAQIEEKVVEIMYGYNLAKLKYYNDIGESVY
ncbi:MAG: TolC family protein [Bacillota bacterium]